MRSILPLAIATLTAISTIAPGPAQTFEWVTPSDLGQEHLGASVSISDAGISFVTGFFVDEIDFGNGVSLQAQSADRAGFVARFDQQGNCDWAALLQSNIGDVQGIDVEVDPAGNEVTVVGFFEGDLIAHDGTNTTGININGWGGRDGFIARYDDNGNLYTLLRVGGFQDAEALSVTLDPSANVFVTGYFTEELAIEDSSGTSIAQFATTNPAPAAYVVCLDPSLSAGLWLTQLPSSGTSIGTGIAADGGGSVYVTGWFTAALQIFEDSAMQLQGGTLANVPGANRLSVGGSDIFVASFDQAGALRWAAGGGSSANDQALGITAMQLEDWNAYDGVSAITGFYEDELILESSPTSGGPITVLPDDAPGLFRRKAFVAMMSPLGAIEWGNMWGSGQSGASGPDDGCVGRAISFLGAGSDSIGVTGQIDHIATIMAPNGNVLGGAQPNDDIDGVMLTFGLSGSLFDEIYFGMNNNQPGGYTLDFGAGIDGAADGWVLTGTWQAQGAEFAPFVLNCGNGNFCPPRFFLARPSIW